MSFVTNGELLWAADGPASSLPVFREGLENLPRPDPHGVEFRLRLNIGSIHQQNGHLEEARAEYDSALSTAVRPESHLARLYLDIATIARELGDQTRMAWAASNVLSVERALGAATDKSSQARELLAQ